MPPVPPALSPAARPHACFPTRRGVYVSPPIGYSSGRVHPHGNHPRSVGVAADNNGQVPADGIPLPRGAVRLGAIPGTTPDPMLGRFASPDSLGPGGASGQGCGAATLGHDERTRRAPLITDFHGSGFVSGVAREDAFTQANWRTPQVHPGATGTSGTGASTLRRPRCLVAGRDRAERREGRQAHAEGDVGERGDEEHRLRPPAVREPPAEGHPERGDAAAEQRGDEAGTSSDTRAMRRQLTMNSRSAGSYATPPASARARTTASLASAPRSQRREPRVVPPEPVGGERAVPVDEDAAIMIVFHSGGIVPPHERALVYGRPRPCHARDRGRLFHTVSESCRINQAGEDRG